MTFIAMAQVLIWSVCVSSTHAATACAPSTDAAVLQALSGTAAGDARGEGFRVRDVVVDPLLHRAFVHVEQCGHPERPLVLLSFAAADKAIAIAPGVSGQSGSPQRGDGIPPAVAAGSPVAVAMGDAHMRLLVHGRLLQSAAVGSDVDVQLASLQDGPAVPGEETKRVHGRLTSPDRVEVQP